MGKDKRLIDANALGIGRCDPDLIPIQNRAYCAGWNGVVNLIEQAPTVDAVEVVRCKDCKHHKLPAVLTQKYGEPGTLTCHNWHSPCNKRNVKQDDFCSYGERKDNEENSKETV